MRFSVLFSLLAAAVLMPSVSAKVLHVYLLTGQSNSLGAVKGDPLPDELLQLYSTEQGGRPVLMWNGNMSGSVSANEASKNLVVPDEGKQWEPVAPQLPAYGAKCMGPEFGFAYTMRRLSGTNAEDIAVIKCSRDGGGNEQWAKGQSLYGLLLNSVHTALERLDKKYDTVVLEGVLYLQGESNRTAEGADTRFLSFCEDLRKDIKAKPLKGRKLHVNLKKAVVGECATWGTQNNATVNATAAAMRRMAEADAGHRGFVVTRDLDKITAGDGLGVHYDGVSQLTIGARFAYQMARLNQSLDTSLCVRGQEYEGPTAGAPIYLNDGEAWWRQVPSKRKAKLPARERISVWNLSSANMKNSAQGTELLAADMEMGGIRIEDPYSEDDTTGIRNATVTIAPAAGKAPVLSIGKGGIELQHGHLSLQTALRLTAPQTWTLGEGRTLTLAHAPEGAALDLLRMKADSTLNLPDKPLCVTKAELAPDTRLHGGAADGTLFTGVRLLSVGGKEYTTPAEIPLDGATLLYGGANDGTVKARTGLDK